MKRNDVDLKFDFTHPKGTKVHVCLKPIKKCVSERTNVRQGLRAGDVIRTATIQEQQSHSLLRSMDVNQEPNSEPMPIFSRNFLHGSARFDAAKQVAQLAAEQEQEQEQPKKTSSESKAD